MEVCFGKLLAENKKTIEAIGVSGQQHGFVPLDKNGNALYNIKLWCDTATAEECKIITKAAGGDDEVVAELGNLMLPGEYVMEYGDASGTALFDSKNRKWSKKICDLIDSKLYELLPKLIEPSECAGKVSEKAAKEYGIPVGIPVSAGGSKSPAWRQIAADIMNLPIRVPLLDEAAALGGAVQALWYLKNQTEKCDIAELCAEHIKLDDSKSTNPIPENVQAYDKAYAEYSKIVETFTPLYL